MKLLIILITLFNNEIINNINTNRNEMETDVIKKYICITKLR